MRPVDKGAWPTRQSSARKLVFNDWTRAIEHLRNRTGWYCHLCEMRINNLMAIEHIKSRRDYPRLAGSWTNFLLSCAYCNSRKLAQRLGIPYRKRYVWPHLHNTLMAFEVPLAGPHHATIQPKSTLADPTLSERARALIRLYKLDAVTTSDGAADTRYIERLEAIQMAAERRGEWAAGKATPGAIVALARKSGFFSVWFNVFSDVPEVKRLLVGEPAFAMNPAWFDGQLNPVARVPAEAI